MNIQVPTRTVSGTGSYNRNVVLQGRWQEHTSTDEDSGSSTANISLSGTWEKHTSSSTKSGTKNITMSGTWGYPTFSGTSNVWQLDIDVPSSFTWSGTTVKSWTSDDMEYGHLGYILTAKLTDRGTVPSGASININIDPDRLSLSVTISARQTIHVAPTTITLSVTTRSSCTWTASDTWTIDVSEENAYIASVSYVSGAPRATLSYSSNIVTARWSSSSYRSGTVSNVVKVTYNYPVTTSRWKASISSNFSSSHDTTTVTHVSYVSGTVPNKLDYSGNTITAYWETTSDPGTSTVSCTARVSYDWTDTTSTSYWTATDSYTLSDTGATITNATYVTGTQPSDVNYSGRTITLSWYSSTEPSGNVAGTTMRLTYSAPYSSTYANVYFNGTRVNYVYFNGTRYP